MKLEEYVAMRKKEDGINEFDLKSRAENTRICVNYIFEYFNNYLDIKPSEEMTLLTEERINKYRRLIHEYSPEVKEWLISFFISHSKHMHKYLANLIKDNSDVYFFLYDSATEFRALSYKIYSIAIKKFDFLKGHSEMIYAFVKDYHRIRSKFFPYEKGYFISDRVNEWINNTYSKFGVNILRFCIEWSSYFGDHLDLWTQGHKIKSENYEKYKGSDHEDWCYDYDYKQKKDLFGLDSLYRKMPKKSFTRGRKQEFEAVLLYYEIRNYDTEYWDEYRVNVLEPS